MSNIEVQICDRREVSKGLIETSSDLTNYTFRDNNFQEISVPLDICEKFKASGTDCEPNELLITEMD
jgi:hypothetical protein